MENVTKNLLVVAALILIIAYSAGGQSGVKLTENSRNVDVRVEVGTCSTKWPSNCPAKFEFFYPRQNRAFQLITVDTTFSYPGDVRNVEFGDFNFDGLEDVAIGDGMNGGYITPSYQIFLFSKRTRQYVHSADFTKLSQGPAMGLFTVDRNRRQLYTGYRLGCCYFVKEGYDIFNGRPRNVYKLVIDQSSADRKWDITTTKKLVNGRWRTWVKRERPR